MQHGVPDLLIAPFQGMGAPDSDHAIPEVAVAEAAPGLDKSESPVRQPMLVHQPPGHSRNAVQPRYTLSLLCPFRPLEQAIGGVPARLPASHLRSPRIELHDLAAHRPAGAGERHFLAHPAVGARLVLRRHHRAAPRPR